MKLIDLDWYSQSPIDFEHKQYLLYAYMSKVDQKYLEQKVSPHLLHLERMKEVMDYFISKWIIMQKVFDKNRYAYFDNPKIEDNNAILDELEAFADAINTNTTPVVTLQDGTEALRVANQIINCF